MTDYKKLISFLEEFTDHFSELLTFENNKLKILLDNDPDKLKESLGKEQALVMKSNSLESKRLALLEEMGLKDKNFRTIIEQSPAEHKVRLQDIYNNLTKYIMEIKRVNKNAMANVDMKMDMISKKINNGESNTYDKFANKQHIGKSSTSISKNI